MLYNDDSNSQTSQLVSEINAFYIEELSQLKSKSSHVIDRIKAAWKTELSAAI